MILSCDCVNCILAPVSLLKHSRPGYTSLSTFCILECGWARMDEFDKCAVPLRRLILSQHSPRAVLSTQSQKLGCKQTVCTDIRGYFWWQKLRHTDVTKCGWQKYTLHFSVTAVTAVFKAVVLLCNLCSLSVCLRLTSRRHLIRIRISFIRQVCAVTDHSKVTMLLFLCVVPLLCSRGSYMIFYVKA